MWRRGKRIEKSAFSLFLVLLSTACATTRPYLNNESGVQIDLVASPHHAFTLVTAYKEGTALVLHGKVEHTHGYCPTEGHVDLALLDADGKVTFTQSLPLYHRSGRVPGWHGAAFRSRVPVAPVADGLIRLAFHDRQCSPNENFNCGNNAAGGGENSR